MSFFTRLKLAKLDKKITQLLRNSSWYIEYRNKDITEMSLRSIDKNEKWVIEVSNYIDIIWNNNKYRKLIEEYNLDKKDLIDFFLLMTIATMPNPIFKTGPSRLSNTLVGSAMYQEVDKQLNECLTFLGHYDNEEEQKQYGHRYASDVMSFALHLQSAHEKAYGKVSLENVT